MKAVLFILFSVIFSGCSTIQKRIDKAVPEGSASLMKVTASGYGTTTTFLAEDFNKTPEKVTAKTLHQKHGNGFTGVIEIEAKDYVRFRTPQAAAKEQAK